MIFRISVLLTCFIAIAGCGVSEVIRKNDDRYATPGAMDSPLTNINSKYAFDFMRKYAISHEWVNTSACAYRATELPNLPNGRRSNVYVVPEIYEADGKTMQASNASRPPQDFDRWVRSVTYISQEKGKEGQALEVGLRPVCFESWWTSSHYLRLRLQKSSLPEFEATFTQRYPEGKWRSESLNGLAWRVQQVAPNQLRPRPLNGVGGPYQIWLTALGDTGYVMSFEMGASKESLDYPQQHAAIEKVFMHLVRSLRVQPLLP